VAEPRETIEPKPPLVDRAAGGAAGDASEPKGQREEVIMVVDDDALVRSVAVDYLEDLGYTVVQADSARAALATLQAGQPVALILTDVVMPDMTGRQLADAAFSLNPQVKVLYCTGYGQTAVVHNLVGPEAACLTKPYTRQEMASQVRHALDH
jgi:CheY-like chemotaxis protein